MTIGERIALLRKGKNLSQEALSDIIGVSRQSISKWEIDGALPEMEKLIAMCKYFGVTINYLLGLELEGEQPQNDLPLNENLDLILKKYTDESKVSNEKARVRSKKVFRRTVTISVVIILCLSISLMSLFQESSNLKNSMNNMNNMIYQLEDSIDGIADRVRHELEQQNDVINKRSGRYDNFDIPNNTCEYIVEIVPKEYVKDMTIEIEIDNGETVVREKLFNDTGEVFSGAVKFTMTNSVSISAIITKNGLSITEQIERNNNVLNRTMLDVSFNTGIGSLSYGVGKDVGICEFYREGRDGSIYTLNSTYLVDDITTTIVTVESVEGTVYHNDKLIQNVECVDNKTGSYEIIVDGYKLNCKAGDTITEKYVVTDNFGRKTIWENILEVVSDGDGFDIQSLDFINQRIELPN